MVPSTPLRQVALAAALLFQFESAAALSLGRLNGVALIGRPLDVSISATLDSTDGSAVCVEADVYQGDTRVNPQRVTVQPVAGPANTTLIRITSTQVVDEPIVTLYVRAGCTQKSTRRYVMLSEFADEVSQGAVALLPPLPRVAPPTSMVVVPSAPATGTTSVAPRSPVRRAPQSPTVADTGAAPPPAPSAARAPAATAPARPAAAPRAPAPAARAPRPPAPPRAAPAPAPSAAARQAQSTRSRLRLEPLDLTIDRDPVLRSSRELLSQPGDDARRAEAAALWRTLNAPPEEIVRDLQRVEAIENDLRTLRDLVRRNTAAMEAMREQVEKARAQRNAVSWVLAAALLALLGAGGAWVWSRWRQSRGAGQPDWWRQVDETDSELAAELAKSRVRTSPQKAEPSLAREGDVDLNLGFDDSGPSAGKASRFKRSFPDSQSGDFQVSQSSSIRMVNAEELIDIQQQAEFFLSIGQHDQAIAVLEAHIHSDVETSALAWLDLLEIYHSLGRRADFDRIRTEFQNHFNGQVPSFDGYAQRSEGLEVYPKALSRIVALWPSPRVMTVIEESIFRRSAAQGGEPFDLEAYRELVLLYNVAKELNHVGGSSITSGSGANSGGGDSLPRIEGMDSGGWEGSSPAALVDFSATSLQPLSAAMATAAPKAAPAAASAAANAAQAVPHASPNLGVDIDLTALNPPDESDFTISLRGALERAETDLHQPGEPLPGELAATDDGAAERTLNIQPQGNLIDFDFDLAPRSPDEDEDKDEEKRG